MPETVAPGTPAHPDLNGDLSHLAAAFGIGDIHGQEYLPAGLMNRNWRVTASGGDYALKQIIDVPLATARRNLRVVTALVGEGVPTCPPVLGAAGDPVVEVGNRGYCLLPWLEGDHLAGPDLTLDQARQFGQVLGQVHDRLDRIGRRVGLPAAPAKLSGRTIEPAAALLELDRFQAAARSGGTSFDEAVVELLDRRRVLIDKYAELRPASALVQGRIGWTHGDMQHRNVIWLNGIIRAVIDWDRIRVRPLAEEVARTVTIVFGAEQGRLDLARASAFVSGYRAVVPLPVDDLADGVRRLWWKRMSDFWHLDFHYDRGDHSCDPLFLTSEAFLGWWTEHRAEVEDAFSAQP
ncbi:phosphotransferase [Solwaraspora sp. WMMD1047]|uniref:phosphotransferase n=1 Tax=Solwaraspora sp. WMMD1047 TaxID=3016102 RepID=UPI00241801AD|nr:phosphotransferase [Solwaraspora sp. WMMD1047]MDG4834874.1 phosphotransferase [Solwaraspora sp. WMMD1047]MDG4834895.1 phosphotransferase [Solwaraspora sp. WMMD1047]